MSDTAKSPPPSAPTPVSQTRLKQIATDACTLALENSDGYDHSRTEAWNGQIINHILRSLISESKPEGAVSPPWKFIVNSTIIQHLSGDKGTGRGGKRGMHSACGGYWNAEKDSMWSFKHETKGMDVVVSVIWIAV